ncbi:MAG: oxidoreductase, partial [Roseovarius indicus]
QEMRCAGNGFCGTSRQTLLTILQDRCIELGVKMEFGVDIKPEDLKTRFADSDVIIAGDGINSAIREHYKEGFQPSTTWKSNRFCWMGSTRQMGEFNYFFRETEHGQVVAHCYQYEKEHSTWVFEMDEATWQGHGLEEFDEEGSKAKLEEIFAEDLQDHPLLLNRSNWRNFPRVFCENWYVDNIVILGDAKASAHFSIGSGTKLAVESAIALAEYLTTKPSMEAAFEAYQDERRLEVLRLQSAARNSLEWFEEVHRYLHLDPVQFNYSLLTRSQRISHENLRLRDAAWLEGAEKWFQTRAGGPESPVRSPMFAPYRLREMALKNRIVVSPMAQYKAVDGCPTDWHLVHLGERAKGGAGLVYTEMTCVSPEGRITPGCPGLYAPEHEAAWRRVVDFVHGETDAKICCQIGHSGRKGSTQLGWEEMDAPLAEGNWETMSASAIAWSDRNAVPREMTREDMDRVRDEFVAAAEMAERAGFDMIELHAAHGYLISSFISPVSNVRQDEYGGSLENRLRYPLEVFEAMRAVWPEGKPMAVRISANDWVGDDGVTPEEAVEIAKAFHAAGADIIDVSAGQTSTQAKPVYGRMFQTPFSDRIRNETGIATMAVGNIYEADHANSILMAGRADLVCLARPHLADPYWTLHAGAAIGDRHAAWPLPYEPGRDQLWRLSDREAEAVRV